MNVLKYSSVYAWVVNLDIYHRNFAIRINLDSLDSLCSGGKKRT